MKQEPHFTETDPTVLEQYGKDVLLHDCLTGKMQTSAGRPLPSSFRSGKRIPSDVLGSYTGTGLTDNYPIQDADDL